MTTRRDGPPSPSPSPNPPRASLRGLLAWLRHLLGTLRARRREERLTVAVDIASFYEPLTGIGWYLYQLLVHLAQRDDLRLRLYSPFLIEDPDAPQPVIDLPRGPALEVVTYPAPGHAVPASGLFGQLLRRALPLLVAADGNALLFAPNYLTPPSFRWCRGRVVATVHDLSLEIVPWAVRPDSREALARRLSRTFARAAYLLTPSEAVRGELIAAGHFPGERIRAIHHGPGQARPQDATISPAAVPAEYGLCVGTLEPRKNLVTLIDAWGELHHRRPASPPLVLCGRYGWQAEEIESRVRAATEAGWLIHLGYVEVGELVALYQGATLALFPTLYEGFGLPALEALRLGAPLVTSDLPVLREVAGEAAVYVAPQDAAAWTDTVESLLGDADRRAALRAAGLRRAAGFSWQDAADQAVSVFHAAAGR